MKIIMFIVIFLLLGAFFIISEEGIKLNNSEDIDKFIRIYSNWVDKLIGNTKTVSSYLVKMEWLPEKS